MYTWNHIIFCSALFCFTFRRETKNKQNKRSSRYFHQSAIVMPIVFFFTMFSSILFCWHFFLLSLETFLGLKGVSYVTRVSVVRSQETGIHIRRHLFDSSIGPSLGGRDWVGVRERGSLGKKRTKKVTDYFPHAMVLRSRIARGVLLQAPRSFNSLRWYIYIILLL